MGLSTNSAPEPIPQYELNDKVAKELANNPVQIKGLSQQAATTAAKVEKSQPLNCITPEAYKDLKSRIKTLNESVLSDLGRTKWGLMFVPLPGNFLLSGIVHLTIKVIDWFETRSLKQRLEKMNIQKPEDYDALINSKDISNLSKAKLQMMKGALLVENKKPGADYCFELARQHVERNCIRYFGGKSAIMCYYLAQAEMCSGRYEKALKFFKKAVKRAPTSEARAFFLNEATRIGYENSLNQHQPKEAIKTFIKAVQELRDKLAK